MSTILWSFGIWSKLERWKSLISGCFVSCLWRKKIHLFEVFPSLILCNSELFIDQIVMYDENWILYQLDFIPATTISMVRLRRSSKALRKARLAPKKVSWSLLGDLLLVWSIIALWILAKPVRLRSIFSKLMRRHQKLQCLQPALVNRMGPVLLHNTWPHITQPVLQKLNELVCEVLPHLPYSPDLSSTNDHFFKHLDNFLQGKCFYNQQEAENAFQEFFEYAREINQLIGKNVLIIRVSILISKDVFEPN